MADSQPFLDLLSLCLSLLFLFFSGSSDELTLQTVATRLVFEFHRRPLHSASGSSVPDRKREYCAPHTGHDALFSALEKNGSLHLVQIHNQVLKRIAPLDNMDHICTGRIQNSPGYSPLTSPFGLHTVKTSYYITRILSLFQPFFAYYQSFHFSRFFTFDNPDYRPPHVFGRPEVVKIG